MKPNETGAVPTRRELHALQTKTSSTRVTLTQLQLTILRQRYGNKENQDVIMDAINEAVNLQVAKSR